MWVNAQCDGHPAEYRWRRVLNAAKFGSRPLLECPAVTLPILESARLAKSSLAFALLSSVSKFCLEEWQEIWDCREGNKLVWHIVSLFAPLLAFSSTAEICSATILYYSTDLVILVSLTHTYCVVMLLQPVTVAECHLQ